MSRGYFNCASGISVTVRELADFVLEETGSTAGIEYAPPRPGDIADVAVDNTKLRSVGVEFAVDWRAMVREVIATERAATEVESMVPNPGSPAQRASSESRSRARTKR